mgnify:CR=1 FL=1
MQLTLSYAALLVLAGLALFVIGLLVLRFIPEGNLMVVGGGFVPGRIDLIRVFVQYSLVALGILAVVGLGGGWLMAGRVLAPLTRITDAARQARDGSLSHRIAIPGRQNELAELADTFDDMLARVERSVDEHRLFAANASHELRTPLAVMRTILEVARADPASDADAQLLQRLEETNERSIALVEALLMLGELENRELPRRPTALDALVRRAVAEADELAGTDGPRVHLDLAGAVVRAHPAALLQLVANLVHNAVQHNVPDGEVWVTTSQDADGARLTVANTGDEVARAGVDTLADPFVRGAGRTRARADRHRGAGLGLAIVSSIASAHGAHLTIAPRDGGGLVVDVLFPAEADGQLGSVR